MWLLYNIFLNIIYLFGFPYFIAKSKRDSAWKERLGDYPKIKGKSLWFHASSVGEVSAILALIKEFKNSFPEHSIVVSTFTTAGRRRAEQLYQERIVYLPLDFNFAVKKAIERIHPDALIIVETELWPNLLRYAKNYGCKIFLVNGRISQKSYIRYTGVKRFIGSILRRFDLCIMQSREDAERLEKLGAESCRIKVAGNLKFDNLNTNISEENLREMLGVSDRKVFVAGSTREGEEEIIFEAFNQIKVVEPNLVLILAPRHIERIERIKVMAESFGLKVRRKSEILLKHSDVVLVDTIGDLPFIYGIADIAFVGGSLLPYGGHNPIEPASYGIPVLFGPYMEVPDAKDLLKAGSGIVVKDALGIIDVVVNLLKNDAERNRIGELSKYTIQKKRGASRKTLQLIKNALS